MTAPGHADHHAHSHDESDVDGEALRTLGPFVAALVISSPALIRAFTGTGTVTTALVVFAVVLSGAWILSAAALRLREAALRFRDEDAPAARPPRRVAPLAVAASTGLRSVPAVAADPDPGPQVLGRIPVVQVPADEAIPGTPPTPSESEIRPVVTDGALR